MHGEPDMLEPSERKLLTEIRKWKDTGPPSWKEPWWNYILIGGGIVLLITDALATGSISGAAGGFMLGVGLLALLLSVPFSRRLRNCYRLVSRADEAKAFEGE